LEKLAEIGINLHWLLTGEGEMWREGREERYKGLTRIPRVGKVPAGELSQAFELPPEYIYEAMQCSDKAFAVRVHGDSMEPVLQDGDIVIIEPAREVKNGDIALVRTGSEVTIKKVVIDGGLVILQPFNHRYAPIVLTEKNRDTVIIGPVVRLIRDM